VENKLIVLFARKEALTLALIQKMSDLWFFRLPAKAA
jgi:hypothetical protein